MFERLAFAKIEVWLVALVLVAAAVGAVLFGSVVHITTKGSTRFGPAGEVAVEIARLPERGKEVISQLAKGNQDALRAAEQRFPGRSGFSFSYAPGSRPDLGHLALARYDGDLQRSVVELVDLNSQQVVHRWLPDYASLNSRTKLTSNLEGVHLNEAPDRDQMKHPFLFEDGSLLYKNESPLVKIDVCSKPLWINERLFHHSIEPALGGGVWVPIHFEPQTVERVGKAFEDDGIAHVMPDGRIVFEKSLAQILIENNLGYFLFAHPHYTDDPMHLNDIQQAESDSPYWQKGDLFLSVRNISTILLYRPSENRIVWHKQWPWVKQHDVDILDDHRIAVFDNQYYKYKDFDTVNGSNDVKTYDFATGETQSPWTTAMAALELRTTTQGRSEILPGNRLFVEETNSGRLVMLDAAGNLVWEYVNRAANGSLYVLNWSRMISRGLGDQIAAAAAKAACP